ncbi:hypothetical protein WS72_13265 [Burkholderia savannae]|uniref:ATPase n=1 Tax=Burkholderia savannae TaxID=1637837 RepID=A0ABR5TFF0_9BURK|nr:hypothetical protein [Burkholderia savannae]KWZ43729.1 hypothetical protein WS72_13265 [Burkholderia savannae]
MTHKTIIETLDAEIRELCTARSRAEQDIERMEALAQSAREQDSEINELRQQRETIQARALIEGEKADTAELDRKIAAREKAAATARATAEAIPRALELLRNDVSAHDDEISERVQKQRAAARALLDERYTTAEQQYIDAAAVLGGALVQMAAIEHLRSSQPLQNGIHAPANALQMVNNLREDRSFRVPHRASAYTCEEIWPHGAPLVNESEWSAPAWLLDPPRGGLVAERAAEQQIEAELRELGVDL